MRSLAKRAGLVPFLIVAGCGAPDGTGVILGSESSALVASNGHVQNGHVQNGQMTNGHVQNGRELSLAGVDLSTMQRLVTLPAAGQPPDLSPGNLVPVPNVRLVQGLLTDGVQSGAAFAGTVVYGALSDGQSNVPVYIQSFTATSDPEVPHYVLQAYHQFSPAPGQRCDGTCPWSWDYACGAITLRPPCKYPPGSCGTITIPTAAIAVGGQWDYNSGAPGDGRKLIEQGNPAYDTHVTFACTDGAIGKCVEKAHYKPWANAAPECRVSWVGLWPRRRCWTETQEMLHEACVRMVRADYCGDGVSMTVDGIGIDLWDESSINTQSEQVWGLEGEWTPNGARCLDVANMGRTSATLPNGEDLGSYLYLTCGHKWDGQYNQSAPFRWEDNDCFKHGPASLRSSYYTANLPPDPTSTNLTTLDMHDRVWIQNRSMCVYVDGAPDMGNPDANNPLCL